MQDVGDFFDRYFDLGAVSAFFVVVAGKTTNAYTVAGKTKRKKELETPRVRLRVWKVKYSLRRNNMTYGKVLVAETTRP